MRKKNPHMTCDTCIISVDIDRREEEFSLERLYAGAYTVHLLAGQHICLADKNMLEIVYKDTATKDIPSTILHKNVDIYLNLTGPERQIFVRCDNERSYQKMTDV